VYISERLRKVLNLFAVGNLALIYDIATAAHPLVALTDVATPEYPTEQEDALATADVSHLLRGRYMHISDPVPFQQLSLLLRISDDKPQHRQEYALG
jgi:hypothetical protein